MRTAKLPFPIAPLTADLFRILRCACQEHHDAAILRVAGGWVRDQLMGRPSNDIDIAIETVTPQPGLSIITGEVFAQYVTTYLKEQKLESHSVSVIRTNPDKSKHLETATTNILGINVEFCHLRTDDYSTTSRIPVVQSGTPQKDAERRAFTVNALFYNLHTEMVEDFTTGLSDLETGILRCPLEPGATFLDDPLRILRGVRFTGQLGFGLHNSIYACVTHPQTGPQLQKALMEKVSRERIGIEFQKMCSGDDPTRCCSSLFDLSLMHSVVLVEQYVPKDKKKSTRTELSIAEGNTALLQRVRLYSVQHLAEIAKVVNIPKGYERLCATVAMLLVPLTLDNPQFLALLPQCDTATIFRNAAQAASWRQAVFEKVEALTTFGLKLPNRVATTVSAMLDASFVLSREIHQLHTMDCIVDKGREAVGHALKALKAENPDLLFPVCLVMATLRYLEASGSPPSHNELRPLFEVMMRRIEADSDGQLRKFAQLRPVVRGDEIASLLKLQRNKIGEALDAQSHFLLHRPAATREEVLGFLQERFAQ